MVESGSKRAGVAAAITTSWLLVAACSGEVTGPEACADTVLFTHPADSLITPVGGANTATAGWGVCGRGIATPAGQDVVWLIRDSSVVEWAGDPYRSESGWSHRTLSAKRPGRTYVVLEALGGRADSFPVFVQDSVPLGNVAFIAAASEASCGITVESQAFCWGDAGFLIGFWGDVGTCFNRPCAPMPAPIQGGVSATSMYMGEGHACLLDGSGSPWCWGDNRRAQFGAPLSQIYYEPYQVSRALAFSELTVGDATRAALPRGQRSCVGVSTLRWGRLRDGPRSSPATCASSRSTPATKRRAA